MKTTKWIIGIAVMTATMSMWAAESPSESLQKGLFEEEANHNLEAAIKAYQSVIQQTDEQRKLGATAIFRLGECYRKLGRTNDALVQYRRLLREFPDQEKLVQNSQQLEGELSGRPAQTGATPLNSPDANSSAEAKELQRVKRLVKDSPDLVNSRGLNNFGGTLLHQAAGAGWFTVAEFLLANQAEVNITDTAAPGAGPSKRTPLHHAAAAGHKSMVELLLAHGADVNAADSTGHTPLHDAASRGYKTVVEALLAGKANVNARADYGWTPLHSAARNGHRMIGAVLLKNKADANARTTGPVTEGMAYSVGVTPLIVAAIADNASFIELLCEAGADINAGDEQRSTALHYAASSDAVKSIATLLRFRANPNAETRFGSTPLQNAMQSKNKETVQTLLDGGAKPNVASDDGTTPLITAAQLGRLDFAQALLAAGANANVTNRPGHNPLGYAVDNLNEPLTELLLTNKANPNMTYGIFNYSPLHTIVRRLHNTGFPSNDPDYRARGLRIIKLLLAHKAEVNLRDSEGLAPLNFFGVPAKRSNPGDEEVIALLKEHGAIDDLPELAPMPSGIRVWRKGLATGRAVFYRDSLGRNRFTLLEALWSFYSSPIQYGGRAAFRPTGQPQDSSFDFPDLSRIVIRRLVKGKTYEPFEVNFLKGPEDQGEIDCSKNLELEYGDVVEIPEREHALGEPPTGLEATFRGQMQGCVTQQVKLTTKAAVINLALDPASNRYLSRVLTKTEAMKVIVSSADFSKVKVTRHDAKSGKAEQLTVNVLDIRRGAKSSSEDLLLRDGDEIQVPEK